MPLSKNRAKGSLPSKTISKARRMDKLKTTSNPLRGSAAAGFASSERKVELDRFQEKYDTTVELLQNYRQLDGKDNDAFVNEVLDDAAKLWRGKDPLLALWTSVMLCHGGDATAAKLSAALGDYSVNAALILSILAPYLFEAPDAVNNAQWSKISFNIAAWASFSCFVVTVLFMTAINLCLNGWTREIDLLNSINKYYKQIIYIPGFSFIGGCTSMMIAMAIAQTAAYNPIYVIGAVVAAVSGLYYGMFQGAMILGGVHDAPSNMTINVWDRLGFFKIDPRSKPEDKQGDEAAAVDVAAKIADVLDTPIDVLRQQNQLAKVLDDDTWRQTAMRSSLSDSSMGSMFGDSEPGISMSPLRHHHNNNPMNRSTHQRELIDTTTSDDDETEEEEEFPADSTSDEAMVAARLAMTEALELISPELGCYAEDLTKAQITPNLLDALAADTQLCINLGMSAGHALLLKVDSSSTGLQRKRLQHDVEEAQKKVAEAEAAATAAALDVNSIETKLDALRKQLGESHREEMAAAESAHAEKVASLEASLAAARRVAATKFRSDSGQDREDQGQVRRLSAALEVSSRGGGHG